MKTNIRRTIMKGVTIAVIIYASSLHCIAEEIIKVERIASEAQSALIQKPDGKHMVVHVGDTIQSYGIIQTISKNRIILMNHRNETVIVTLHNGKQRIRRIERKNLASKSVLENASSEEETTTNEKLRLKSVP